MALSVWQRWGLIILKMVSSLISVFSSSILIFHVYLRYRGSRQLKNRSGSVRPRSSPIVVTPFHRLISGLSVMDVLSSLWSALGTIPVPADSGVVFGLGTTATCTAQGFFLQFVFSTALYLASLSIYFMLRIRYNVSDDTIYRYFEFWLHGLPWIVAIVMGSLGIHLKLFNPLPIPEMGCGFGAAAPWYCVWDPEESCERGYRIEELFLLYTFLFSHIWMFGSLVVVVVCNILIYCAIRKQERRNQTYLASRLMSSQASSSQSHYADKSSLQSSLAQPSVMTTSKSSVSNLPTDGVNTHRPSQAKHNSADATQHKSVLANDPMLHRNTAHDNDVSPIFSSSYFFPPPADEDAIEYATRHVESKVDDSYSNNQENDTSQNTNQDDRRPSSPGMSRSSGGSCRRRVIFDNKMKASRTALRQSILYVATSFSAVIWTTLPFIYLQIEGQKEWPGYLFAITVNGIVPLQGFFVLIIFVRLDYLRRRQIIEADGRTKSRWRCIRECLFSPDIHQ